MHGLSLDLCPLALTYLEFRNVNRSGPRGDAVSTRGLLERSGLPSHEAVLAFEEEYGGLQLHESDFDPEAASLCVGPYACLSATSWTGRERDLVPVIFTQDDLVFSLDARGHGWVMAAMVEGISRPCARDGRQLLTQAILWRALSTRLDIEVLDGNHGASRAHDAGLPVVPDASSDTERWWGNDLDLLVVEIDRGNGFANPTTYVGTKGP